MRRGWYRIKGRKERIEGGQELEAASVIVLKQRGQNIVSMVNKTESFFSPFDNPSLPSPYSHRPSRPVAFFQPPLSQSVKWVTSPFPLVNRCDGTEKKAHCAPQGSHLLSVCGFHFTSCLLMPPLLLGCPRTLPATPPQPTSFSSTRTTASPNTTGGIKKNPRGSFETKRIRHLV